MGGWIITVKCKPITLPAHVYQNTEGFFFFRMGGVGLTFTISAIILWNKLSGEQASLNWNLRMLFAAQCAAPCCRLLRMTHTVFLCSTWKREFPAGQRQQSRLPFARSRRSRGLCSSGCRQVFWCKQDVGRPWRRRGPRVIARSYIYWV